MRTTLLLLAVAALTTAAACNSDEPPKTSADTAATPRDTSLTFDQSTPTGTFTLMFQTAFRRDIAEYKKLLSNGSIALLDTLARTQGKTLDDMIGEDMARAGDVSTIPRVGNEMISGDSATIQVELSNGEWHPFPFVKEGGAWKLALDKLYQDALNEAQRQMGDSALR